MKIPLPDWPTWEAAKKHFEKSTGLCLGEPPASNVVRGGLELWPWPWDGCSPEVAQFFGDGDRMARIERIVSVMGAGEATAKERQKMRALFARLHEAIQDLLDPKTNARYYLPDEGAVIESLDSQTVDRTWVKMARICHCVPAGLKCAFHSPHEIRLDRCPVISVTCDFLRNGRACPRDSETPTCPFYPPSGEDACMVLLAAEGPEKRRANYRHEKARRELVGILDGLRNWDGKTLRPQQIAILIKVLTPGAVCTTLPKFTEIVRKDLAAVRARNGKQPSPT